jgi:lipopolysaccharide/colanic/teichoic acid biosynthesis glycosyltransferase
MTESVSDGFKEVIRRGEKIETQLQGRAYLESPQKRQLDKYGAAVLGSFSKPLVLGLSLAVHAADGGLGIISLPRVGKDGEIFGQRKIRSMSPGTETQPWVQDNKQPDDLRITRLGKFIRQLSVDELPQFGNVWRGDMSLVGPRPKAVEELTSFMQQSDIFYSDYTSTRPGITGFEQIHGRGLTTTEQRIEMTHQYVEEASLALDLDILRKTAKAVTNKNGAF